MQVPQHQDQAAAVKISWSPQPYFAASFSIAREPGERKVACVFLTSTEFLRLRSCASLTTRTRNPPRRSFPAAFRSRVETETAPQLPLHTPVAGAATG